MRPDGMRLWGVWRAMEETCLEAWTSCTILKMQSAPIKQKAAKTGKKRHCCTVSAVLA